MLRIEQRNVEGHGSKEMAFEEIMVGLLRTITYFPPSLESARTYIRSIVFKTQQKFEGYVGLAKFCNVL